MLENNNDIIETLSSYLDLLNSHEFENVKKSVITNEMLDKYRQDKAATYKEMKVTF